LNSKPQVAIQGTTILDPVGVWLNKPVNTWKLLYKWTRDPKTNEAWHRACNGKGPTVTIIRTKDGHVFGGFSQITWSAPAGQAWESKESKLSFIFSLTDGKNRQPYQCLPFQNYKDAICLCESNNGFGWGYGGSDLWVYPGNVSTPVSTNLNSTYKLPEGFTNSKTFFNWFREF